MPCTLLGNGQQERVCSRKKPLLLYKFNNLTHCSQLLNTPRLQGRTNCQILLPAAKRARSLHVEVKFCTSSINQHGSKTYWSIMCVCCEWSSIGITGGEMNNELITKLNLNNTKWLFVLTFCGRIKRFCSGFSFTLPHCWIPTATGALHKSITDHDMLSLHPSQIKC